MVTALNAPTVEKAYDKICSGNGVSDQGTSVIQYMVYIERRGKSEKDFWRKVSAVWEVERVVDGVPVARLLHRWNEDTDTFEVVNPAQLLDADAALIQARAGQIRSLVETGQTSAANIEALIAG